MATYNAFTITTSTYTVLNTYAYDLYYVDTSVSNTAITITLPSTVNNGGNTVRFMSVTSVLAGNTNNNAVTIVTASTSQSLNYAGITQLPLPIDANLTLIAQNNGATGLWLSIVRDEFVGGVYGDGSDGTVTATTSSLAQDTYYNNLIVPNGVTLRTANSRLFVRNLLTLQGTGRIINDGNNGNNGNAAVGGTAGAGLAFRFFSASGAGGAGASAAVAGSNAATTGTTQSVGGSGGGGGAGGTTAGGTGGTTVPILATLGGVKGLRQVINSVLGFVPTGLRYFVANGGGGGGGATSSSGGGGGGGAGILLVCARNIVVTGTGSRISANGGNGGNAGGTNGGGGGGGGGGAVIIVTQTPDLTTNYSGNFTVSANGGTGGTRTGTGIAGTNGNNGNVVLLSM
jgi:hypothetical protein